jgi:hypothetical protein
MSKLVPTRAPHPAPSALPLLLDRYKTEFELMCIQFLSGGWKLAVRDSVMLLYGARGQVGPQARQALDDLLTTDGEAVRALLELAEARGPAELQVCDAQLRRARRRHTDIVFQLHRQLAGAGRA